MPPRPYFERAREIGVALLVVPGVLELAEYERWIVNPKIDAVAVALLRIVRPRSAASPSNTAPSAVRLSVRFTRRRAPKAASGGEGPPLGRSTEVIAGQPIEAFVKTSVYLVLKNSLSAASCPALRETVSLPHFCSNQISYSRVDGSASTPLTTRKF